MRDIGGDLETDLVLPESLSERHRELVVEVACRNDAEHGADLLGLALTGSAGRGLATHRSDVDVLVVLADGVTGRSVARSSELDEIPFPITELDDLPAFATPGWWDRWSCAWTPVLLDRTGGRLAGLLQRQAEVDDAEAEQILVGHDRLDGWVNYAFRALKNDRDGRALERRLDAAESVPWLLDTVFTLAGRVRPYHKYLPWELREHSLADWDADTLLGLLQATLDGDPAAIRAAFARVERLCSAFDERRGRLVLGPILEGWGAEQLDLLRG